jgi:hypothetical protein
MNTKEWIIIMCHARLLERILVVFRNDVKVFSLTLNKLHLRVSKQMSQP